MNRWYFWVLAPVMLATAIGLPLITEPPTLTGRFVLYLFSATLICATVGLAAPRRFGWALQFVAGVVLFAYLAYASSEALAWWYGKPFGFGSSRGETNLLNALTGLVVFGLPSIYFLLSGRTDTDADVLLDVEEQEPEKEDW
jgi:hypothetical protein